ncbi:MAG TPA: cytochrome c maturation protein CcmE [Streptosporangiaceae bacterium]|nr:cytochrome c maturation protein CcmE [Streptosporangiaceae bacterium]
MSQDLLQLPSAPAELARHREWLRGPRLRVAACLAVVVLALGWIAVRGLTGNFVYYLTPTDVVAHHKAHVGQRIRLGGYVVRGSVHHHGSVLMFTVTDFTSSLKVSDTGAIPELFKAGQGVVLEGVLGKDGLFHADTTLVQHNGNYFPPKPGQPPPHRADLKAGG